MNSRHNSMQQTSPSLRRDGATPRLQGRTLALARTVWIAGVIAALIISIVSTPAFFAALHTVSATGSSLNGLQLTAGGVRELHALGLSLDFYAAYLVALNVIFVVVWFVVGGIIFWRKSDERMALYASFILMLFAVSFTNTFAVDTLPSGWWIPVQCIRFIAGFGLSLFFYIFPDGRFMPRWTRWLAIGWIIYELNETFFSASPFNPFLTYPLLGALLFIAMFGSLVAVLVYRYRRVFNLVQRQQAKWAVSGTATAVLGFIATLIVAQATGLADNQSGPLPIMIGNTVLTLCLLLIPLSIGFAILRSRLWEIDIIINRSLVYGSLTISLALIYAGTVLALQTLLGSFTAGNQFAIVGSTLLIVVLFQPFRHRIQAIIDRRFYRRKYDAARTLQAFNATLRGEVELNQLREQLVAVVEETMQPAHVSLWLRPVDRERKSNMDKAYDSSSKLSGVSVSP